MTLRITLSGLLLFCLAIVSAAESLLDDPGSGVTRAPSDEAPRVPLGYAARIIEWDWDHPLLRAEIVVGVSATRTPARPWSRLFAEAPDAVAVQLSPPTVELGRWGLALPYSPGPRSNANDETTSPPGRRAWSAALELPSVGSAVYAPWLAAGTLDSMPSTRCEPLIPRRLGNDGMPAPEARGREELEVAAAPTLVATHWLGPIEALEALPGEEFRERAIVSWSSPRERRVRFAVVEPTAGPIGRFDELLDWFRETARPGDWFALHATGEYALASAGPEWLAGNVSPRTVPRVGVALVLRRVREGEPVDWTRLEGSRLSASSAARDFPPGELVGSLPWRDALSPSGWVSCPRDEDSEPMLRLEFSRARPARHLLLAQPSTSSWSDHFDAAGVGLGLFGGEEARPDMELELDEGLGPLTVVEFADEVKVKALEYRPAMDSEIELDPRARLTRLQLWGPWDGQAGSQAATR